MHRGGERDRGSAAARPGGGFGRPSRGARCAAAVRDALAKRLRPSQTGAVSSGRLRSLGDSPPFKINGEKKSQWEPRVRPGPRPEGEGAAGSGVGAVGVAAAPARGGTRAGSGSWQGLCRGKGPGAQSRCRAPPQPGQGGAPTAPDAACSGSAAGARSVEAPLGSERTRRPGPGPGLPPADRTAGAANDSGYMPRIYLILFFLTENSDCPSIWHLIPLVFLGD